MILWIDVETTGLEPADEALLELAAVLTGEKDQELFAQSWLVYNDPEALAAKINACDPYVYDMHTRSGLWAELLAPDAELWTGQAIGECLIQVLAQCQCKPPVGGFSPQFDVRWLRRYVPALLGSVSHRVFDVSTLKHAVRLRYGGGSWGPSQTAVAHRALADTRSAITWWRWFRKQAMIPYAGSFTRYTSDQTA